MTSIRVGSALPHRHAPVQHECHFLARDAIERVSFPAVAKVAAGRIAARYSSVAANANVALVDIRARRTVECVPGEASARVLRAIATAAFASESSRADAAGVIVARVLQAAEPGPSAEPRGRRAGRRGRRLFRTDAARRRRRGGGQRQAREEVAAEAGRRGGLHALDNVRFCVL